ncbi:Probable transposase [Clostridium grantii DSM 8605]|uniref:Probable transposase n=1 Tax=Clostridium grantii DSM 8605 TaxID=1121316 RepID=A0A1M5VF40_9CLOT|nr:Probable transposase [Clostridium grantii DSM 8605]
MLGDRIKSYEENKSIDIKTMKYPTPAQYKGEFEWLKEVDSLALANAQMNLDKAYKNFFRDKSVGFPKFKKKTNTNNYTTNNQKGTIYIENNHIKVPSGKYFISILVETEIVELAKTDKKIGVDLGIKEFAITSDGVFFSNAKHLKKSEKS